MANSLHKKEVDAKSPVHIISKGMELLAALPEIMGVTKKELLIKALDHLVSGKDGIVGTDDDIITEEYVRILRMMIDNNIVDEIITVIKDASKGKYNLQSAITHSASCIPHCVEGCLTTWLKKKH